MAMNIVGGLNSFYLIELLENLSQLQIGYDNDIDDINQDLVLQFLKEGFQTIVDSETRWPWFESEYTSVANFGEPFITNFALNHTYSPYFTTPQIVTINEIKEVVNVIAIQGTQQFENYGNELIYIGQHQAERIWIGATNQTGIPGYFSMWSNRVYMWPRPNQLYTLYIRGYRQPSFTWLQNSNDAESTDYVDLDLESQACLISYTMSRMYQFQEDPEMSGVYRNQFATNLKNYQDYLTAPSSNQPIIFSGGLQLSTYGYGLNVPGISVLQSSSNIPSAVAW